MREMHVLFRAIIYEAVRAHISLIMLKKEIRISEVTDVQASARHIRPDGREGLGEVVVKGRLGIPPDECRVVT